MVDKPDSVFDKLDRQEGKIDDISEKLEGISIKDLYALAKRTFDYGDYETAQKYYNHISLLNPLDWEAPLWASLCNYKGYHDMFFWSKLPEKSEKIIVSTIKYINSLDLDQSKKESELSRCLEILREFIDGTRDHYYRYKDRYDDIDNNFAFVLQEWILNIFNQTKDVDLECMSSFRSFLADECLDVINLVQLVSSEINRDMFEHFKSIATKHTEIDYDALMNHQEELNIEITKSGSKLTPEEKNTILLNGKMFFEFSDKVIAKRASRKNAIYGTIIVLTSLVGAIFSFIHSPYLAFAFLLSFITGIIFIIKSMLEKDRVNCSSFLANKRKKCRLSSTNAVVREDAFSFMLMFFVISMVVSFLSAVMVSVMLFTSAKEMETYYKTIFCVCSVIGSLAQYINVLTNNIGYYDGEYRYLYKGKFYTLE